MKKRCIHCQRVLEGTRPKYKLTLRELAEAKFCSMACFGKAKKGKSRAQFRALLEGKGC